MRNLTLAQIMNENFRRRVALREMMRLFNPTTGLGCSGYRIPFNDPSSNRVLHLLQSQLVDPDFNPLNPNLNRIFHDFEYWYSLNYKSNPLTLAHKELLLAISQFPVKNRFIIKHHSNMGISSVCEAYILWLQFFRTPGTDALFIASDYDKRNISKSYFRNFITLNHKSLGLNRKAVSQLTPNMLTVTPSMQTNFYITPSQNKLLRGTNPQYILCSNANSFYRSARNGCDDFLYPICTGLIPVWSDSLVIIESNSHTHVADSYFNQLWQESVWNETYYLPVEIEWNKSQANSLPLNSSIGNFIASLSCSHLKLWDEGLTLEQINWFKHSSLSKNDNSRHAFINLPVANGMGNSCSAKFIKSKNSKPKSAFVKSAVSSLSIQSHASPSIIYCDYSSVLSCHSFYYSATIVSRRITSGKSPPGIKGERRLAMNLLSPSRVA